MAEPNRAEIVTAVGVETRRYLSQFKTTEELRTAFEAFIASNSVEAYVLYRELDYFEYRKCVSPSTAQSTSPHRNPAEVD